MTAQPVQWVLVIFYGSSAHRATYGRLDGDASNHKYTKDYIQLSRKPEFLRILNSLFPRTIMDEVFSGDECHLFIHDPVEPVVDGGRINCKGWVFLVIGNGEAVISDYTAGVESMLQKAIEISSQYM